jgi:hypothetical protein
MNYIHWILNISQHHRIPIPHIKDTHLISGDPSAAKFGLKIGMKFIYVALSACMCANVEHVTYLILTFMHNSSLQEKQKTLYILENLKVL